MGVIQNLVNDWAALYSRGLYSMGTKLYSMSLSASSISNLAYFSNFVSYSDF